METKKGVSWNKGNITPGVCAYTCTVCQLAEGWKDLGFQSMTMLTLFNSIQQVTGTITYNENMEEGEIQSSWK